MPPHTVVRRAQGVQNDTGEWWFRGDTFTLKYKVCAQDMTKITEFTTTTMLSAVAEPYLNGPSSLVFRS